MFPKVGDIQLSVRGNGSFKLYCWEGSNQSTWKNIFITNKFIFHCLLIFFKRNMRLSIFFFLKWVAKIKSLGTTGLKRKEGVTLHRLWILVTHSYGDLTTEGKYWIAIMYNIRHRLHCRPLSEFNRGLQKRIPLFRKSSWNI